MVHSRGKPWGNLFESAVFVFFSSSSSEFWTHYFNLSWLVESNSCESQALLVEVEEGEFELQDDAPEDQTHSLAVKGACVQSVLTSPPPVAQSLAFHMLGFILIDWRYMQIMKNNKVVFGWQHLNLKSINFKCLDFKSIDFEILWLNLFKQWRIWNSSFEISLFGYLNLDLRLIKYIF